MSGPVADRILGRKIAVAPASRPPTPSCDMEVSIVDLQHLNVGYRGTFPD